MEELERRVEELEIRLSFQNDLIRQLDGVIQAQAGQLDDIRKLLTEIQSQVEAEGHAPFTPADEVPPHY